MVLCECQSYSPFVHPGLILPHSSAPSSPYVRGARAMSAFDCGAGEISAGMLVLSQAMRVHEQEAGRSGIGQMEMELQGTEGRCTRPGRCTPRSGRCCPRKKLGGPRPYCAFPLHSGPALLHDTCSQLDPTDHHTTHTYSILIVLIPFFRIVIAGVPSTLRRVSFSFSFSLYYSFLLPSAFADV
ncbi:hypothetical protein C8R45DRAFT_1044722, partial [Mycena sanguinolenta]